MFLQLENTFTPDYITEKLTMAYKSGAIPVYWGPAETYDRVLGNHTILDPCNYSGPLDLSHYLCGHTMNTSDITRETLFWKEQESAKGSYVQ